MIMDYFWKTKYTIDDATGGEFVGMKLFGASHLAELFFALLLCLTVCICYRHAKESGRKKILTAVALLGIADEAAKDIFLLLTNQFRWEFLPLHLCSINLFVILFYLFKPSRFLAEWLYAVDLPAAVIALAVPSWNKLPVLSFMHLHSYSVHILLLLFPLILLSGGHRPNIRQIPLCAGALVAVSLPIFGLNRLLNTNFFFLNGTDGNFLLELFADLFSAFGSYGYLLGFPLLLAALWLIMYLPWQIRKRKRKPDGNH